MTPSLIPSSPGTGDSLPESSTAPNSVLRQAPAPHHARSGGAHRPLRQGELLLGMRPHRPHMAVLAGIDFFTVEVLTWRGLATFRRALGGLRPARMPIQAHSLRRSFVTPGVERVHRSSSLGTEPPGQRQSSSLSFSGRSAEVQDRSLSRPTRWPAQVLLPSRLIL
jgi:hypothetical protein